MKLIADSGASKTNWALISEDGTYVETSSTGGLNPYHHSPEQFSAILGELTLPIDSLSEIHFYGAGCTSHKKDIVTEWLAKHFHCEKVFVYSDLLGAARSLARHESGIICILGTGSNSAYYDGQDIRENVPPLGYILGDEGSGAVLGRELVSGLFKDLLPAELKDAFTIRYQLDLAGVIERVYKKPLANQFLASLAPFITEHIEMPEMQALVDRNFRLFVDRNLFQYAAVKDTPIHFAGSIAWYFRDRLQLVLEEKELTSGQIVQDPLPGLIDYHQAQ